jgi:hypothetical protein
MHWNIVRVCRVNSDRKQSYPRVIATSPWKIFLGWPQSQERVDLGELLVEELDFRTLNRANFHYFSFLSREECVVCLVGPPDKPKGQITNFSVNWDAAEVNIIVAQRRHQSFRAKTIRCDNGETKAAIHCNNSFSSTPGKYCPKLGAAGPWQALEVHTMLRETGITTRIEHHHHGRVPLKQFWTSPKTLGTGGYATEPPEVLAQKSQAAICWMFALREALRDLGFGTAINSQLGGHVSLMGFETNNPLHDDHCGVGAHFHVGIRKVAHAGLIEETPHIYLNPNGSCIPYPKNRLWNLANTMGLYIADDCSLHLARIVTIQSLRTPTLFVNAQNSPNNQVTLSSQESNPTNLFCLIPVGSNSRNVVILNMQRKLFVHVDTQLQELRHPVVLTEQGFINSGSIWQMDGEINDCRLINCRSGLALHVLKTGNQLAQYKVADGGSRWKINPLGLSLPQFPLLSYQFSMSNCSPVSACVNVCRDGVHWKRVATQDKTSDGQLQVEICCTTRANNSQESYIYDNLTGTLN